MGKRKEKNINDIMGMNAACVDGNMEMKKGVELRRPASR